MHIAALAACNERVQSEVLLLVARVNLTFPAGLCGQGETLALTVQI